MALTEAQRRALAEALMSGQSMALPSVSPLGYPGALDWLPTMPMPIGPGDPDKMGAARQTWLTDNGIRSLWTGSNPDSPPWANTLGEGLNTAMMAGPHFGMVKAYHGTTVPAAETIASEGFRIPKSGEAAAFFTDSPEDAATFAKMKGSAAATVSKYIDDENLYHYDARGEVYDPDMMAQVLSDAKAAGAPGVLIKNIVNFEHGQPTTTYAIFNPSDLIKGGSSDSYLKGSAGADSFRNRETRMVSYSGLSPIFAARISAAIADAEKATGGHAVVTSAYRTYADQQRAWNNYQSGRGGIAARPGKSLHEQGMAFDLAPGPVRNWIQAHASTYGLEAATASDRKRGTWGRDAPHIQLARGTLKTKYDSTPNAFAEGGRKLPGVPVDPFGVVMAKESGVLPSAPARTLRKGMTGDDVSALQQQLAAKGYDIGVHGADGKYGKDTALAVRNFEVDNHQWPADSVAGKDVRAALNTAPAYGAGGGEGLQPPMMGPESGDSLYGRPVPTTSIGPPTIPGAPPPMGPGLPSVDPGNDALESAMAPNGEARMWNAWSKSPIGLQLATAYDQAFQKAQTAANGPGFPAVWGEQPPGGPGPIGPRPSTRDFNAPEYQSPPSPAPEVPVASEHYPLTGDMSLSDVWEHVKDIPGAWGRLLGIGPDQAPAAPSTNLYDKVPSAVSAPTQAPNDLTPWGPGFGQQSSAGGGAQYAMMTGAPDMSGGGVPDLSMAPEMSGPNDWRAQRLDDAVGKRMGRWMDTNFEGIDSSAGPGAERAIVSSRMKPGFKMDPSDIGGMMTWSDAPAGMYLNNLKDLPDSFYDPNYGPVEQFNPAGRNPAIDQMWDQVDRSFPQVASAGSAWDPRAPAVSGNAPLGRKGDLLAPPPASPIDMWGPDPAAADEAYTSVPPVPVIPASAPYMYGNGDASIGGGMGGGVSSLFQSLPHPDLTISSAGNKNDRTNKAVQAIQQAATGGAGPDGRPISPTSYGGSSGSSGYGFTGFSPWGSATYGAPWGQTGFSNSPFTKSGYTAPSFNSKSGGATYAYKPDGYGGGTYIDSQGREHTY